MTDIEVTTDATLLTSFGVTEHRITDEATDWDGIALYDINNDGQQDVVVGGGVDGVVDIFFQDGDPDKWTNQEVTANRAEVESVAAKDIDGDGDGEIFVGDQGSGELLVYTTATTGDYTTWDETVITTNAIEVQTVHVIDLDGDGNDDIVYAAEGTQSGEGGIFYAQWNGNDLSNAGNWTTHRIADIEGAWHIAPSPRDWSGNGVDEDYPVGARDNANANAQPGLYWIEPPTDVTNKWTVHNIDTTSPRGHAFPLDGTGDGVSKDIINDERDPLGTVYVHEWDSGTQSFTRTVWDDTKQWRVARPVDITDQTGDDLVVHDETDANIGVWTREDSSNDWKKEDVFNADKADADGIPLYDFNDDGYIDFASCTTDDGANEKVFWGEVSKSTSIDITVYEDVGDDGTGSATDPNGKAYDNSATVSINDGLNTYTLSGFDGSSGNAVWVQIDLDSGQEAITKFPSINSVAVEI